RADPSPSRFPPEPAIPGALSYARLLSLTALGRRWPVEKRKTGILNPHLALGETIMGLNLTSFLGLVAPSLLWGLLPLGGGCRRGKGDRAGAAAGRGRGVAPGGRPRALGGGPDRPRSRLT